jgi:hypothetical protein
MDIILPNSLVELPRFSGGIQHKSGGNKMTHIREREISQDTGTTTVRPHLCLEWTDRDDTLQSAGAASVS